MHIHMHMEDTQTRPLNRRASLRDGVDVLLCQRVSWSIGVS